MFLVLGARITLPYYAELKPFASNMDLRLKTLDRIVDVFESVRLTIEAKFESELEMS